MTEADRKKAKARVKERVSVELVGIQLMEKELMEAVEELIEIAYRYNVDPKQFRFSANPKMEVEVNRIMARLRDALADDIYSMSMLATEEEDEDLIAYYNSLGGNHSIAERVHIYTNRFKFEIEAFIAAGLISLYSKQKLRDQIRQFLYSPYQAEAIKSAMKIPGVLSARLRTKGISYGVGQYRCSANMLARLMRGTIATVWWQADGEEMRRMGAIGYYQLRGSSYPCELCDIEVGYHPIEDDMGYPHAHCKCYRVPVYANEIY